MPQQTLMDNLHHELGSEEVVSGLSVKNSSAGSALYDHAPITIARRVYTDNAHKTRVRAVHRICVPKISSLKRVKEARRI